MKSFFKNPHNSAAWNYRMWVLRLSHVFIFIIHLNRQEVMFVSESKDNKSYLRDTNETIFASRWRVFSKTHITQQHGITECEYCVYLMFSFSLFTSTDRRWCLFPSQEITKAIFATPTKQCLLADEEFSSKNPNNWAAWNYRMWVLRLSHVFIFIIHLNRQEVMFVSDSKYNKSYLRDTNETIFASRWRVLIKKNQITEQHGITECEYCVYLTFSFSLFTSTDRRWCLFPIQKITKAIFATPTKQFLLADEEFSSKFHITQQHGITEREYCVYLTFSFSIFTSFNRQEVMLVCKSEKSFYLRDTNETIFASRWRVFIKKPK